MRDGEVAHQGTPDEVMRREIIRSVYDMDVEIQDVRGRKITFYYT
jgi:iron complex transport system ATP-binding protein